MSTITVETIKAHIRAKIAAGEACIKDMIGDAAYLLPFTSDSVHNIIRTRNRALLELLNDIERGVLITEDSESEVSAEDIATIDRINDEEQAAYDAYQASKQPNEGTDINFRDFMNGKRESW